MAGFGTLAPPDIDPLTGLPLSPALPARLTQRTPVDDNYAAELADRLKSPNLISEQAREGLRNWVEKPGRTLWGSLAVEPEIPGQITEGDVFRQDQAARDAATWGAGTAFGMLGVGTPAGMLGPAASVGAAGGRLARDPVLYHGISKVKLPKPIEEMSATHVPTQVLPEKEIFPSDLQGGMLLPALGDRSIAGTNLTGFNGYNFERPVEMQGGHGFMAANADKNVAWASGKPVIGRIASNVRKLSEGEKPVYFPYTAMGERSVDFSHHVSDSLAEALKQQPLSRAAQREFNAAMKSEDANFGAIEDWPGVGSEGLRDYLVSSKGDVRNKFAKVMDTSRFQSLGFPSVAEARFAATDPRLLDAPTGAAGLSVAKLDPAGRVVTDVSGHRTYDTDLGGNYVGGLGASVPKEVFYPDLIRAYKKLGYEPYRHDYLMARGVEGAPIAQRANQQWVDSVSNWIEKNTGKTLRAGSDDPAQAIAGQVAQATRGERPFGSLAPLPMDEASRMARAAPMDAAAVARSHPDGIVSDAGDGVIITKRGDTLAAEVDGKKVGSLNLSWRGPYSTHTEVAPEMQRRGIASRLYRAAEDVIGRPLVPSPLGLSESANAFWKRRLSDVNPQRKQELLRESAGIGVDAGVPKSAAERMSGLGWDGTLGAGSRDPAQTAVGTVAQATRDQPFGSISPGIRAYHGSPHDFDRFSLDKIGTGEGAQAYGHGLYFAENEKVAREYRDALSQGKSYGNWEVDWGGKPPGHMYEVKIGAKPEQFLDWDKPLSQQPQVFDALRQSRIIDDKSPPYQKTGKAEGRAVIQTPWQDTRPEAALREAGIPGIRYLDQGSRRVGAGTKADDLLAGVMDATGGNKARAIAEIERRIASARETPAKYQSAEGIQGLESARDLLQSGKWRDPRSSNYVVFDPGIIDILRKYAVPGALGTGAAFGSLNPREDQ